MDPRSQWVPPLCPVGSPGSMGNSTKGDLYTYIHSRSVRRYRRSVSLQHPRDYMTMSADGGTMLPPPPPGQPPSKLRRSSVASSMNYGLRKGGTPKYCKSRRYVFASGVISKQLPRLAFSSSSPASGGDGARSSSGLSIPEIMANTTMEEFLQAMLNVKKEEKELAKKLVTSDSSSSSSRSKLSDGFISV